MLTFTGLARVLGWTRTSDVGIRKTVYAQVLVPYDLVAPIHFHGDEDRATKGWASSQEWHFILDLYLAGWLDEEQEPAAVVDGIDDASVGVIYRILLSTYVRRCLQDSLIYVCPQMF